MLPRGNEPLHRLGGRRVVQQAAWHQLWSIGRTSTCPRSQRDVRVARRWIKSAQLLTRGESQAAQRQCQQQRLHAHPFWAAWPTECTDGGLIGQLRNRGYKLGEEMDWMEDIGAAGAATLAGPDTCACAQTTLPVHMCYGWLRSVRGTSSNVSLASLGRNRQCKPEQKPNKPVDGKRMQAVLPVLCGGCVGGCGSWACWGGRGEKGRCGVVQG